MAHSQESFGGSSVTVPKPAMATLAIRKPASCEPVTVMPQSINRDPLGRSICRHSSDGKSAKDISRSVDAD